MAEFRVGSIKNYISLIFLSNLHLVVILGYCSINNFNTMEIESVKFICIKGFVCSDAVSILFLSYDYN